MSNSGGGFGSGDLGIGFVNTLSFSFHGFTGVVSAVHNTCLELCFRFPSFT